MIMKGHHSFSGRANLPFTDIAVSLIKKKKNVIVIYLID